MKRITAFLLCVFMIFMVGCSGGKQISEIKERGKLRVGVKSDVPGFSFCDEDGNYTGIEIDIAKAIAKALFGDEDAIGFVTVNQQTRAQIGRAHV